MNGKTSIYLDGAGLVQYSQYCMLNTNKASFIAMSRLGKKKKMPKNNVAKKCRTDNYNRNIYKRNI